MFSEILNTVAFKIRNQWGMMKIKVVFEIKKLNELAE